MKRMLIMLLVGLSLLVACTDKETPKKDDYAPSGSGDALNYEAVLEANNAAEAALGAALSGRLVDGYILDSLRIDEKVIVIELVFEADKAPAKALDWSSTLASVPIIAEALIANHEHSQTWDSARLDFKDVGIYELDKHVLVDIVAGKEVDLKAHYVSKHLENMVG